MSSTGLLAIDLQRVFADPASDWAVPGFAGALDGTRRLLAAYDGRAVLTRWVPDPHPTGAWADYRDAWPVGREPADSELWQLVPEVAAYDVPVLDAPTMGKWHPEVAAALGDPDTLLLTGVATECCVLATAVAAAEAGVRVRLVTDACAGGTPADHDAALRVLAAFAPMIQPVTLADVL